jgi:cellulose biosynthesis protein BcsS
MLRASSLCGCTFLGCPRPPVSSESPDPKEGEVTRRPEETVIKVANRGSRLESNRASETGLGVRGKILALLIAFALFPATPLRAGVLEGFAGLEGDSRQDGYGFAGIGVLIPAGRYLNVPLTTSVSYLFYNYDSTGTKISVRSPGTSLMTGIRVRIPRGSISAMAGGEMRRDYRDTNNPGIPQSERTTFGFVVQTYDDLALARRWQASGFGVYVGAAKYVVGRAAMRYQVTNIDWKRPTSVFVGVEGVRQGNDLSDALQAGGFAEWNLVRQQLSVSLHSGYKESWSPGQIHQGGRYFGVGLYRHF